VPATCSRQVSRRARARRRRHGRCRCGHHLQLDEKVALKFLAGGPSETGRRCSIRSRGACLRQDQERACRAVTDVGELENRLAVHRDGIPGGRGPRCTAGKSGPMPIAQAVDFILQALRGDRRRSCARHRSWRSEAANLFCTTRPNGGSPSRCSTSASPSSLRAAVGSHANQRAPGLALYMSPERCRNESVDARTTSGHWSHSLRVLAGRTPFVGESLPELAVQVAMRPARPFTSFRRCTARLSAGSRAASEGSRAALPDDR